ncbi:MAG: Ig-like domain-containing protein [Candidatus Bathycorpusculaceae bacterium]
MKKASKITALLLIAWLTAVSFTLQAESSVPLTPMTIEGYVFVRRVDGSNRTVPAGFGVYAKENATVINVEDSQQRWITDANGHYRLGASASADNVPIDMWVENMNVTRIIFHQGSFLTLNLTVIDAVSPTIQVLTPTPGETLPPNQPTWINATITDNFAVDSATIIMTLNETALTPAYKQETGLLSYQTDPLEEGLYIVSVAVEDLAGNHATETWNFTVESAAAPPTIEILSPTTANPAYVKPGQQLELTIKYTELNPLNATIKIYNATYTVLQEANQTAIVPGTDRILPVPITVPAAAPDGKYDLSITMFNIYNLSATATQTNAIIIDNTNPSISNPYQEPPGQVIQPGETVEVEAGNNITVKVTVAELNLQKVSLYYNISATQWVELQMNPTTGNEYAATIPSSSFTPCTTIHYYIVAVDKAGNTAQTPMTGVYFGTHIIPEFTILTIIVALLAFTVATTAKRKNKTRP